MLDKREAALAGAARYSDNYITHHTAEHWQRVSSRRRCPVCHHATWCRISNDEAVAGCMRIDLGSFKTARTRGGDMHLHRLHDHSASIPRASPATPQPCNRPPAASIDHRQAVYSALLDRLLLSREHAAFLLDAKRLSHETVTRNLYATAPAEKTGARISTELAEQFDLTSVPGFYETRSGWRFDFRQGELLIPCRDHRERIAALLRRTGGEPRYLWASSTRHGGPSSGAPVHFALPYLAAITGEIIITEGPLKADAIAERLHCAVVGISGVSSFGKTFGRDLRAILPSANLVAVAFDADEQRNTHVRAALVRMLFSLDSAAYVCEVLQWDEAAGKGLDDVLGGGVP